MIPTMLIFHDNCPDGVGSAWWLARHIDGNVLAHPGVYGQPPPDVAGVDVWLLDFSYPPDVMADIAAQARSVTVLDHHQTAANQPWDGWEVWSSIDLFLTAGSSARLRVVIDQTRSGVGLVSELVRHLWGALPPAFLANIEDRDLWRFALPDTPAVCAAVTSFPLTPDSFTLLAGWAHERLVTEGAAITRYRDMLIDQCVANARQESMFGFGDVWVAAAPYTIGSDVAGRLAERDPARFACYYVDRSDGRQWGLRSGPGGMDVAALAALYGGGGHRHAAGISP